MHFDTEVYGGTMREEYSCVLNTWQTRFIPDPVLPPPPPPPPPPMFDPYLFTERPTQPVPKSPPPIVLAPYEPRPTIPERPKHRDVLIEHERQQQSYPAPLPVKKRSDNTGLWLTAAIAFAGTIFMQTIGTDLGLAHALQSKLNPGEALKASESAVFDKLEPRYRVAADETCMHTLPRNRSLAEVCVPGGHYVYGKPLEPEKKGDKPEWLKSRVYFSDAGPNPVPLTVYFPLKELEVAPIRPVASKQSGVSAPKAQHKR